MHDSVNEEFIKKLEWRSFEFLCYSIFKYFGKWDVELNGGGADRGADLLLKGKESGKVLAVIQCKAYSKQPIKVNLVRELLGTMLDHSAQKGIFITTSIYTSSAQDLAKNNKIVLYTTKDILSLFQRLPDSKQQELYNIISSTDYSTPTCVNCGVKLVRRTSKKGSSRGNQFWGCPNFPKCKVTMNIPANQQKRKSGSRRARKSFDTTSSIPINRTTIRNNTKQQFSLADRFFELLEDKHFRKDIFPAACFLAALLIFHFIWGIGPFKPRITRNVEHSQNIQNVNTPETQFSPSDQNPISNRSYKFLITYKAQLKITGVVTL